MKATLRTATVAAALALSTPALAQQAQSASPRVGLGVSMNSSIVGSLMSAFGSAAAPATQLHVPIFVAPSFRLEPSIGFLTVTDDDVEETSSSLSLGVAVHFVHAVQQEAQLYGGVRVASIWSSSEDHMTPTTIATTKQRNTTAALVFGGEYLPSPWFAVGVEGQLEYVISGDLETDTGTVTATVKGGTGLGTQGLFYLRAYFL